MAPAVRAAFWTLNTMPVSYWAWVVRVVPDVTAFTVAVIPSAPATNGVKVQVKVALAPTPSTAKLAGLTVGALIARLGSKAALGVKAVAAAKPLLRTV